MANYTRSATVEIRKGRVQTIFIVHLRTLYTGWAAKNSKSASEFERVEIRRRSKCDKRE